VFKLKKIIIKLALVIVFAATIITGCISSGIANEGQRNQISQTSIPSLEEDTHATTIQMPKSEHETNCTPAQTSDPEPENQEQIVDFITIKGVEYSTSSIHLILSDMGLNDEDIVPLQYMKDLKHLNLNGNQISDISPLSGLTELMYIFLDENQISDISPLSNHDNLIWLFLGGNQISDISPLSGLATLQQIHIRENPTIDISSLPGYIAIKDVLYSTALTELDLSGLSLSDEDIVPLRYLTNLKKLDLDVAKGFAAGDPDGYISRNRISDISIISSLTSLEELYLGRNRISDISQLSNLTNLRVLSLSENRISDISPLSGLLFLHTLYLDDNPISDWSPISHIPDVSGRP